MNGCIVVRNVISNVLTGQFPSFPGHPADGAAHLREEGLLQLHGVAQPAKSLHWRGKHFSRVFMSESHQS